MPLYKMSRIDKCRRFWGHSLFLFELCRKKEEEIREKHRICILGPMH